MKKIYKKFTLTPSPGEIRTEKLLTIVELRWYQRLAKAHNSRRAPPGDEGLGAGHSLASVRSHDLPAQIL